jgi:hypothetical protein
LSRGVHSDENAARHRVSTRDGQGIRVRSVGRSLQFIGLVVPLLAILLQLQNAITVWQMLIMLVASVCLFGIGRIVQGFAAPS